MNWCLHMHPEHCSARVLLPSSQGMLPGGWLHPPHHRSCSRHQRHRRSQSCMARPHIADRWSIGVAHDGKDPWSGLNRRFRATGVFDGNYPTLEQNHKSGRMSLKNCRGKLKKNPSIANVWIVDMYTPCSAGVTSCAATSFTEAIVEGLSKGVIWCYQTGTDCSPKSTGSWAQHESMSEQNICSPRAHERLPQLPNTAAVEMERRLTWRPQPKLQSVWVQESVAPISEIHWQQTLEAATMAMLPLKFCCLNSQLSGREKTSEFRAPLWNHMLFFQGKTYLIYLSGKGHGYDIGLIHRFMFSCISGHKLKKSPTLSLPNQGQTWAQYFLKMGSICERLVIHDEAWWSYIATPTHVEVNWFRHPICRILGDDIINSLTVPSAPSNLPAVPVLSSICDCVRRRMSNLAATCTTSQWYISLFQSCFKPLESAVYRHLDFWQNVADHRKHQNQ